MIFCILRNSLYGFTLKVSRHGILSTTETLQTSSSHLPTEPPNSTLFAWIKTTAYPSGQLKNILQWFAWQLCSNESSRDRILYVLIVFAPHCVLLVAKIPLT